jgi:hypothetical protein
MLLPDGRRALSWSDDILGALLLPDGRRALFWSDDNTLRLWSLAEQRELKRYVGDHPTVVLTCEHQLLMAGNARGQVIFFDLPD